MPTFPVDLVAWLAPLRVQQQAFGLGEGLTVQNQTAGGEVIRSGGAARLWRGSLALAPRTHAAAMLLEARLRVLSAAGASFNIGDMRRAGAAQAAQINSTNFATAGDIVTLKALPVGHVVAAGDYLAFDHSGRRALHQVVTGSTANASGVTGNIEIVPPLRAAPAVGTSVTIGGKCRAVMLPGSLDPGTAGQVITAGATFDWIQTLRETP